MITGFHDVVFPARLAYGTIGGPELQVDIVHLASGFEKRNARGSVPKRRFTISAGRRPLSEMRELSAFFEARGGPLNGFRFQDPIENSTAINDGDVSPVDVEIGTGDGVQTTFALQLSNGRHIRAPRTETLRIATDGAEIRSGFAFEINDGYLTFESAPGSGIKISAGFEYDIPVRFENEQLLITHTSKGVGEVSEISLVEILL